MRKLKARDILLMDEDALWNLPEERHILVFDDGEIVTHTRATIISAYLWYPLLEFPDFPILKSFHIQDDWFSSKGMLQLLNNVVWSIHDETGETIHPEIIARLAFDTVNRCYNAWTTRLSAYVSSWSMFDIIEVMDHPKIKESNAKVEPYGHSIDQNTKEIISVLKDPNELRGNPMADAIKSGTLKGDQAAQGIGCRGSVTDANSMLFPHPVMKGYIQGIDTLHDNLVESRTGTKSLTYNKDLLRETEYFNRKMQLLAQYVRNLHRGDCGSTRLIEVPVLKELLPRMRGKYYQSEPGKLSWLRGDEKHLIGKTILMRSVLSCQHPDPQGICSVCYGRLSFNIPDVSNLGHCSAVQAGDKITSSVLSTKHHESSSSVEPFVLQGDVANYLRYGEEPESLYLKKHLKGKSMKVVVRRDEAMSLADVLLVKDLTDYPAGNATSLTDIGLLIDNGDEGITSEVLRVSLYNRKSSFSTALLEHIQRKHWAHDARGNIVIDLEGFDLSKPLLVLPHMHVNMHEVMKHIQSFLHSGVDSSDNKLRTGTPANRRDKKKPMAFLKNYKDPVTALTVFASMINAKLSLNFAHCEILLYGMMVKSSVGQDFSLPKPGVDGAFEKYSTLMANRSLSAAMAYEKQDKVLINPRIFINKERNSHPYDLILMGGVTTPDS